MKPPVKKSRTTKPVKKRVGTKPLRSPIELSEGIWDRIAGKAYELWEERGHREGYDLEDWYDAEAIILDQIHEARE